MREGEVVVDCIAGGVSEFCEEGGFLGERSCLLE